jgi:hypothetical protein
MAIDESRPSARSTIHRPEGQRPRRLPGSSTAATAFCAWSPIHASGEMVQTGLES